MKESLTKRGIADQYTYTRPVTTRIPKVLNTFTRIKYVFDDSTRFHDMSGLGNGYRFMLVFDQAAKLFDDIFSLGAADRGFQ
jgi:linoleate 10R-lipoxygenase